MLAVCDIAHTYSFFTIDIKTCLGLPNGLEADLAGRRLGRRIIEIRSFWRTCFLLLVCLMADFVGCRVQWFLTLS